MKTPSALRGAAPWMTALIAVALGASEPEGPAAGPPADFRLSVVLFGVGKGPIAQFELIARKGRVFQLEADSNEVVVYDPDAGQVELFDLKRMVQTEVALTQLDASIVKVQKTYAAALAKREAEGGRANRVEAAMGRDLIDPKLQEQFDPKTRRLRLTNESVAIDAAGEPDPEASRLALVDAALATFIKLGFVRDPKSIPPFARLAALHALTAERRWRPTELTILYHLAGPPKKVRWTYHLEPTLTAREVESLRRIDALRLRAPFVRYERYSTTPK